MPGTFSKQYLAPIASKVQRGPLISNSNISIASDSPQTPEERICMRHRLCIIKSLCSFLEPIRERYTDMNLEE